MPQGYGSYYRGPFTLLKSLSIESEPFLDWQMAAGDSWRVIPR